jgi:hypothetical protein
MSNVPLRAHPLRLEIYPHVKEADRRYRVWNARKKYTIPGRSYVHEHKAHEACTHLLLWSGGGTQLELIDVHKQECIGQYVKTKGGNIIVWMSHKLEYFVRIERPVRKPKD